jgi:exosome complex component RRP4
MISFISFPAQPDDAYRTVRRIKDDDDDDTLMDLDYEGGPSSSKLTCPGESLTSAHDYMR